MASELRQHAIVGIDVGGTFTDLWAWLPDGEIVTTKVASTPDQPSRAVGHALDAAGIDVASMIDLSHGTTIATNAFIQRSGAKLGMIVTRGFRDVLEMGRRDRPQAYGMWGESLPLVPRNRRLEVTERIDFRGEVIAALDEDEVRAAAQRLRALDVEGVVVGLLHSYADPAHERRVGELLAEADPDWTVVLSSDLVREFHEFERFSTTAIHAYVAPMVGRYAATLAGDLAGRGYRHDISITQSSGGVVELSQVADRASLLIRSGPAAGVVGSIDTARRAGFADLITADMGGTSFDVAIVSDGRVRTCEEVDMGFRMPLRVASVEVESIGAGGGSIAHLDPTGLLKVGPYSAGSVPGPACYARGGTEPTVTDANLVLGRIGENAPLGTLGRLDMSAARQAIEGLGARLGLGLEETAAGILEIANNNMANLIRMMTVEHGLDPRDFVYLPLGGGGPLHSGAIARLLGITRILSPRFAGVLSGLGSVLADVRHDTVLTVDRPLDDDAHDQIREVCSAQAGWARAQAGAEVASVDIRHQADVCYQGQLHTLTVDLDPDAPLERLHQTFRAAYATEFGTNLARPLRLVALRTALLGHRREIDWGLPPVSGVLDDALIERRPFHQSGEWIKAPVYDRVLLPTGVELVGPCVVQQTDSTLVVEDGSRASSDVDGNLLVEVGS
jgi:N-methylhydantoinase A